MLRQNGITMVTFWIAIHQTKLKFKHFELYLKKVYEKEHFICILIVINLQNNNGFLNILLNWFYLILFSEHGRVQIKVYRGPSDGHFAPWGFWVKQPDDDHH